MSSETPRILISRMSAVGDTILTLPVACALRRHLPDAFLGWVVEAKSAGVVQDHQALDTVIVLERGWFTSAAGILQARQSLRRFHFTTAIDCQSVTKSSLACWLSGARTRIGCRGKYGCELSPLLNNTLIEPKTTHLTDRSRELLRPLGIVDREVEWRYPLDAEAQDYAAEVVRSLELSSGYAVINPAASWNSRLWKMSRFADVARHLGAQHGLRSLVVWGNDREQRWAREIVATSAGHGVLAPSTTLPELAALIRRGRLMISADTGPLHLAVAVGTPCISLHGVTRPQNSGPYGEPHVAIQVRYHAGSRRERRRADNSAMLLITAEMVRQECDALLRNPSATRRAG